MIGYDASCAVAGAVDDAGGVCSTLSFSLGFMSFVGPLGSIGPAISELVEGKKSDCGVDG